MFRAARSDEPVQEATQTGLSLSHSYRRYREIDVVSLRHPQPRTQLGEAFEYTTQLDGSRTIDAPI